MTTSLLLPADPDLVAAALSEPGDALDVRVRAVPDPRWAALGFDGIEGTGEPDGTRELVLPVPQVLRDVGATRALGARLAGLLRAGDLVVLSGPLGAGKTALTQGLGEALGVRGRVTSPTFVLARVHPGPLPLVHVDAYRLRGGPGAALELDDLDLDADLPVSVTVVEWGEGLVEVLAPDRLEVRLARPAADDDGPDVRIARVVPRGARWATAPAGWRAGHG